MELQGGKQYAATGPAETCVSLYVVYSCVVCGVC